MSIIQKNVFGDNIINIPPIYTRNITPELQREIVDLFQEKDISKIHVRCEHGGETNEFSAKVIAFLQKNGFNTYFNSVMMSEMKRGEFSIDLNPQGNFNRYDAVIRIGPIN